MAPMGTRIWGLRMDSLGCLSRLAATICRKVFAAKRSKAKSWGVGENPPGILVRLEQDDLNEPWMVVGIWEHHHCICRAEESSGCGLMGVIRPSPGVALVCILTIIHALHQVDFVAKEIVFPARSARLSTRRGVSSRLW